VVIDDLTEGIVRILNSAGDTVGTGFLLTDDGLIATCAHVVEDAGAGPGDAVRLVFHHTGDETTAYVASDDWRSPEADDVAILHVKGTLPKGVQPVPLSQSRQTDGHKFRSFGYPQVGDLQGMWASGEILGTIATAKGAMMLQLRSQEIKEGMSGAPVLDTDWQQVVGIVNATYYPPDGSPKFQNTAFATPIESLLDVWPDLPIHPAPSQPLEQQILRPPAPAQPPEIKEFVGRESELIYYAQKLDASHQAIITGMAGVGKTALAVMLAEVWQVRQITPTLKVDLSLDSADLESILSKLSNQNGDYRKFFWHTFREGESVNDIIWKMAGFLAWYGQKTLWQMLQTTYQTGGKLPPPSTLFDYLFQMLHGGKYLLCLDDFQFIDDDPLLGDFVKRLQQLVLTGDVSLIITSRRVPEFVREAEFETLSGLNVPDIRRMLATRGVTVSNDLVNQLYKSTGGNAQLLILSTNILKQSQNSSEIIAHLARTDDIERYLVREVDDRLSGAEREIMVGVAVLLGYPSTRDAIEAVVNRRRLKPFLFDLSDRHLLTVHKEGADRTYSQHAIVQAYYYDLPSRLERREMHRKAGKYYEKEEPDRLRAAQHFQRAEAYAKAADLATANVRSLINQGQSWTLRRLLERFEPWQLDLERGAMVNIARGSLYAFFREAQLARTQYQQALSSLETLSASESDSDDRSARAREIKALACWGMGDLLEFESPPEALTWLQRGLNEVAGSNTREEAALYLKIGAIQNAMGNNSDGLSAIQQGLKHLSDGPSQLRANALLNLGIIHAVRDEPEKAYKTFSQALEISRQLHDYFLMGDIWTNLGVEKFFAGDWAGAIADYRQALTLAEQVGSVTQQATLNQNLGVLFTNQGDDETAFKHFSHSLELARQSNLGQVECHSLIGLAHLHLRQAEAALAVPLLDRATQLVLEMNLKHVLPEIYRGQSQVHLVEGTIQTALERAEQAIELARELESAHEEGVSLRVLGQALLANGQTEAALNAFARSLSLLTDRDPYEAARTRLDWGRALLSGQKAAEGTTLLQEARAAFEKLGAKYDLKVVTKILEAA